MPSRRAATGIVTTFEIRTRERGAIDPQDRLIFDREPPSATRRGRVRKLDFVPAEAINDEDEELRSNDEPTSFPGGARDLSLIADDPWSADNCCTCDVH